MNNQDNSTLVTKLLAVGFATATLTCLAQRKKIKGQTKTIKVMAQTIIACGEYLKVSPYEPDHRAAQEKLLVDLEFLNMIKKEGL